MSWTLCRWVWRVEAPLFVGMPPAGSLNRSRLYLPARAIHGAVTAELARLSGNEKSDFPDYGKFGKEVGVNCRFTYLYPAEKHNGKFLTWLPEYLTEGRAVLDGKGRQKAGLRWRPRPQSGEEDFSDRDFRRRLLDSRSGTAIAPETDSASEGTLREAECINPWWRDPSGRKAEPNSVFLLGYAFLRNNGFRRQLESLDTLFVGGDTRYGLGKIKKEQWDDLSTDSFVFEKPVNLADEEPGIISNFVWGHAIINDRPPIEEMWGMKELLGGWDIDKPWKNKENEFPSWAPGSCAKHSECWSIDTYGYWRHQPRMVIYSGGEK